MDSDNFELHLTAEQAVKAIDLLAAHCDLSKQKIKSCMKNGAVWLESQGKVSRIRRATRDLKTGEQLHFYFDEAVQQQQVADCRLISNEDDYSIWYKPPGVRSQGSKWGDHTTISRFAEQQLAHPVFLVHRLDRAAQGLMVLAHNKKSAAALSDCFAQRHVHKLYRAIVKGDAAGLHGKKIETPIENKPACSVVSFLEFFPGQNNSLLEVQIETGRKHQIRRHLAEAGFAVVGDRLYGDDHSREWLALQSVELGFECPLSHKPEKFVLPDELLLKN